MGSRSIEPCAATSRCFEACSPQLQNRRSRRPRANLYARSAECTWPLPAPKRPSKRLFRQWPKRRSSCWGSCHLDSTLRSRPRHFAVYEAIQAEPPPAGPPGLERSELQRSFRARLGATRVGSPGRLANCGGHGASPNPDASSRAANSKSESKLPRSSSMPAPGSPRV